jgi:hypothetical protein
MEQNQERLAFISGEIGYGTTTMKTGINVYALYNS